jgi:alkylation response protein AidB-like acyl-CoA dehydrogenase
VNLRDSPDEAAFREQLRAWLRDNLPAEPGYEWSRKVFDAGYAGLPWPVEYGGRAAPYSHQAIMLEEFARHEAPQHMNVIALGMAGPTIMAHGTEEQKQRYLSKMLSAEEIWCQGFSEPGAGSDLAAVRTRIEPANGHFLVNGQKVWSSLAHATPNRMATPA